jgi:hypothetical protein
MARPKRLKWLTAEQCIRVAALINATVRTVIELRK